MLKIDQENQLILKNLEAFLGKSILENQPIFGYGD